MAQAQIRHKHSLGLLLPGSPSKVFRHNTTIPSKARSVLSNRQATEIFLFKAGNPTNLICGYVPNAKTVALSYGVSEKAVRDIWKGRTWSKLTSTLHIHFPLAFKKAGRPKGSKDSAPRIKGQKSEMQESSNVMQGAIRPCDIPRFHRNTEPISPQLSLPALWLKKAACNATRLPLVDPPQTIDLVIFEWAERAASLVADPFHDDWQNWA
jgi:hypothetical protein